LGHQQLFLSFCTAIFRYCAKPGLTPGMALFYELMEQVNLFLPDSLKHYAISVSHGFTCFRLVESLMAFKSSDNREA
jgi:hypothetical protein